MVPVQAKVWRQQKLDQLFPTIFAKPPQQQPSQMSDVGATNNSFIKSFLEEWKKAQLGATPARQEEKKDEESTGLKASHFEQDIIKTLCGLPKDCDTSLLPKWYKDLFNKNQDDKDRDQIIVEVLNGNLRFKDAKIPVYPELKKVILKKIGKVGKQGETPNLLTHATA